MVLIHWVVKELKSKRTVPIDFSQSAISFNFYGVIYDENNYSTEFVLDNIFLTLNSTINSKKMVNITIFHIGNSINVMDKITPVVNGDIIKYKIFFIINTLV